MATGPFEGAGNQCTVCHTADDHKFVRGHLIGGDLGAVDYPPPPPGVAPDPSDLTCQNCHDVEDLQAIGAGFACSECHGGSGVFANPQPVGRKQVVDMGEMGPIEFPIYQWKYYHMQNLMDLGLSTTSEQVVAGADVDIDGDTNYVRVSTTEFVLNWFMPNAEGGYRKADEASALEGTGLAAVDLTWNGGNWMPVLEPVVDYKTNLEVLGYPSTGIPMSTPN